MPAAAAATQPQPKLVIHVSHRTSPIFLGDLGLAEPQLVNAVSIDATVTGCRPGSHIQMTDAMWQDGRPLTRVEGSLAFGEYDCTSAGSFRFADEFTSPDIHPGKVRIRLTVTGGAARLDTKTSQATIPPRARSARTLRIQVNHRAAPIEVTDVNFWSDQPDFQPVTRVWVSASGCTPGAEVALYGSATQDGKRLDDWAGTHPGFGMTGCDEDGVARISQEFFGHDLHAGKLRVEFTAEEYGSNPIPPTSRTTQVRVPA
ncbi:hypothetical protein [Motilibacter peucedani]|uniref:hypothetical protein n=1 Tax=Motilibacter peucedani TaxID=598650 RepID=UPI000EADC2A6|nr:hypothetical protein [Motilibacter peucedani]